MSGIAGLISSGAQDGFGVADLQRLRSAGYSDSEIAAYLRSAGYSQDSYDNESRRIGPAAWSQLSSSWNAPPTPTRPPSSSTGGGTSGGNTSDILAYQSQLDDYRNQLSENTFKLADYESQLGRYKSDLEASKNQYNEVLGKYNESTGRISTLSQELEKVKADAELNRSNLEAYKKDTVSQQLDILRRGGSSSQGPSSGQANLASGGTAMSRAPQRTSGVNVVANVDATDSVLDHRGPVVDVMRSSSPSSYVTARQRSLAASGASSAAGYYASRFG